MSVPLLCSQAEERNTEAGSRISSLLSMVLLMSMFWYPAPVTASEPQDVSRHLYDRVMVEFKQGDYEAALAGFTLFIELHRKSPLAANAQYWIGECEYKLGRYKKALNSFSNVSSYNALSPKAAASAFKIGQMYSMLGDYYRARLTFDEVLDHYPGGAEAELARKAIQSMSLKSDSKSQRFVKNIDITH